MAELSLTGGVPRLAVDPASGILQGARQIASPNHDARPPETGLDLIVIHGISMPPGDFGGPWIERLFTNELPLAAHPYFAQIGPLRVSSHVVIQRDGAITQYVRFIDRAWHAGKSFYAGREACNDFSVGIELEGTDTVPYEDAQYDALAQVVAALCAAYPGLRPDRIVGHCHIAPGRKTDPGPVFDWARAHRLITTACRRQT